MLRSVLNGLRTASSSRYNSVGREWKRAASMRGLKPCMAATPAAVFRRGLSLPPHHEPVLPVDGLAMEGVKGMMDIKTLKKKVLSGDIDTVLVAFPDMYGRLMGKRFDAEFFLASAAKDGTHACSYLLTCDMDMNPVNGYKFANWERGFGDFHMVPDLATMRRMSWHDKSALVICNVFDNDTHEPVSVAPRSMLKAQVAKLAEMNLTAQAASELEYYMYDVSYRKAQEQEYTKTALRSVSTVVEDYHVLQASREEVANAKFRRHLKDSGIPVENSKGEAGVGQNELNVRYTDILGMADRHVVYKQCLKEIADQMDYSVTFMAKPFHDVTGSGCHIHLSLHHADGTNAFAPVFDDKRQWGKVECSDIFLHFLAGWLKYTPEIMPFYAPNVNSYKRFISDSWAPTRLAISYDNRTSGYRVVGSGNSLRIESRIPGADVNVYLAFTAGLASGIRGIEEKLMPPETFEGNVYDAQNIEEIPKTLPEAIAKFKDSRFANEALGEEVVKHYSTFFNSEMDAYNVAVTDFERKRYFEQV